ncbi:1,25-dihydroxyvitamin D(3) 24-hydroxylase, mitochondrial-like [Rhinatrema bivittatum]|uniref:1,25-dihydroxyvitamin D(3) 24-hydroxylase, mitochondrial-like n=1 Tax=Rhinatrema bivittatum TaxID=194408 RepID=UPI00112E3EB9|nr:1,25-dihydroxyvitamin D(3) 24-hydroxylase, mitochondrial-like [Rhinatrema bivittatum]
MASKEKDLEGDQVGVKQDVLVITPTKFTLEEIGTMIFTRQKSINELAKLIQVGLSSNKIIETKVEQIEGSITISSHKEARKIGHNVNELIPTTESLVKLKSKWSPPPPGDPGINTFQELFLRDIEKMEKEKSHVYFNMSREESQALHHLQNREDIIIKPADKGGTVVVMSKVSSLQEAHRQLANTAFYQELTEHPTFTPYNLSLSSLPGPVNWPCIGSLLNIILNGGLQNQHEIMCQYHQKFGKIFKLNLGTFQSVQIGDPSLLESIFRKESNCPRRLDIKPWKIYRDYRNEAYGLLTLEGQEWQTMRKAIQKHLMDPKEVAKLDLKMNEVMQDFIPYINNICDEKGCVNDLYFELNKWSYETICFILYNRRCGLLQEGCGEDNLIFIKSVKEMMKYLGPLMVTSVNLHRKFNTLQWQKHTQAWDDIFTTVKQFISERLEDITNNGEGDILGKISQAGQLTKRQLSGIFSELQIGGIETTANALMWAIFNLSQNYNAQEKLYDEIQKTLLPGEIPTAQTIKKMPYLRSCLKESMRLTPTIPFTSRTMQENTSIGGFLLPEGTVVMINFHAITWNEDFYTDAKEFKPERWLQDKHLLNPFASTPFGIGRRMCIGRHLAELQLQLSLCWLVQNFKICATDKKPVKAIISVVMIPDRNMPITFIKR